MILQYFKFYLIILLSAFLIIFPALSQSLSYTATINNFRGDRVGQIIRANTPSQLADIIYMRIRPLGNPRPPISIPLGKVNLSTLKSILRTRGISDRYFEFAQGTILTGKPSWESIQVSSIRSLNTTYGISFSKSGYEDISGPIPFRVIGIQNGNPSLRFESSSISLDDNSAIYYAVNSGNSGIQIDWLKKYLGKDSRLRFSQRLLETCGSSSVANMADQMAPCSGYSIKLSRG
jgi:hypothetical protein